jgi:hypothetical protein
MLAVCKHKVSNHHCQFEQTFKNKSVSWTSFPWLYGGHGRTGFLELGSPLRFRFSLQERNAITALAPISLLISCKRLEPAL